MSDSSKIETQPARFGSFFLGVFFAFAAFLFSGLFLEHSARNADWRKCAPAHNGHELVSTTQWEDRTDCFYKKIDPKKQGKQKLESDRRT